jgi:DNA-binding NarL/FixJ family response regulator
VTKRVLIADDHAFVSWGLAKALSALEDVEVIKSVANGIEAIVEIRKAKPDCAILDYNMPGANGLEVFLESKRWSPDTRFVLLTGSATTQTINALVDAGIHGVALKDGTESEIVEIVRQVCAGKTAIGASARLLMKLPVETVAVTDRELAVLQAIARGHTNASAAESARHQPQDGRQPPHQPDAQVRCQHVGQPSSCCGQGRIAGPRKHPMTCIPVLSAPRP